MSECGGVERGLIHVGNAQPAKSLKLGNKLQGRVGWCGGGVVPSGRRQQLRVTVLLNHSATIKLATVAGAGAGAGVGACSGTAARGWLRLCRPCTWPSVIDLARNET